MLQQLASSVQKKRRKARQSKSFKSRACASRQRVSPCPLLCARKYSEDSGFRERRRCYQFLFPLTPSAFQTKPRGKKEKQMAFLVSIGSSMPLSAPKFAVEVTNEFQIKKVKVPLAARISSQATIRTTTSLLASCCSNRDMSSLKHYHESLILTDHFGQLLSCCMSTSSCSHKMLIGYWVGPDIDDGWGFVEAFVNQIG